MQNELENLQTDLKMNLKLNTDDPLSDLVNFQN